MNLIKLLDIANPKKIKDTLNLLITTYDGFDDEIRSIAKAAQKDASDALNNSGTALNNSETALSTANTANTNASAAKQTSEEALTIIESADQRSQEATQTAETALSTANTANTNASAAKQTSEEALTIIESADQRSQEATQTAETALDNANTATQTAELAMNLATQAKSTVDQAISTGVFGTFVHNPAGISLLHAYLTNDINQEDTAENTYVATPTLVKHALANFDLSIYAKTTDLNAYLPLSGGQLTGELRINDKQVAVVDNIPTALSQLSEDTTHRVVTDTEKATWNAKSDFDGDYNSLTNKPVIPTNADFTLAGLKEKSYNSLTDKPTIPTKTSELTNDSNFATIGDLPTKTSQLTNDSEFINKDVNNLTNYLPLTGGTLTGGLTLDKYGLFFSKDGFSHLAIYANNISENYYTLHLGDDTDLDSLYMGAYCPSIRIGANVSRTSGVTIGTSEKSQINLRGEYLKFNDIDLATTSQLNAVTSAIPTKTSQLTNDSDFATISQLNNRVKYSDIVQSTGTNAYIVMSQNAVTTELGKKAGLDDDNVFAGYNTFSETQYFYNGFNVYLGGSNRWTVRVDTSGNLIFQKG